MKTHNHKSMNLPYPRKRTRRFAKCALAVALIAITVTGSIGNWLPGIASFLGSWFPPGVSACANPVEFATPIGSERKCPTASKGDTASAPNSVGANSVPNLSLPQTVLSSLNSLVSDGGVIENSPQNLTLYNFDIAMRLLGGEKPYDQILGLGHKILSPFSFWSVQANASGRVIPLVPISSTFSELGTNSSGTRIARAIQVKSGQYSGKLVIIYTVTPPGPLKWDILFTPDTSGNYQIVYSWHHVSKDSVLHADSKSFTTNYDSEKFTFDWSDIPPNFAVKTILARDQFELEIGLGTITANHLVRIDPTIASSVGSGATAFTFQRKIVFNSQSGYYFAFYHNGQTVGYSSSQNGVSWSSQQSMAPGWPGYNTTDFELSVLSIGQTVIATSGDTNTASCGPGNCGVGVHPSVVYAVGTMSGASISWEQTKYLGSAQPSCSSNGVVSCQITAGYRYVSTTLTPNNTLVFSYNYYEIHQNDTQTSCNTYEISDL